MKKFLLKSSIIFSAIFLPLTSFAQLQAGDLVPVAYRMNATSVNDQVALLTFVTIPQGTTINFTDQKYSGGSPAMCPNSMVWTAPAGGVQAGTVITITTDASPNTTASVGTITANGMTNFGLSSNGDQVIVYTGTNTNPTFITALSSNNWATTGITCASSNNSLIPAGLTQGTNALSINPTSIANTVNGYYNGTMSGTPAQLKALILDPANWNGAAAGTAAQTWPTWNWNIVMGLFDAKHSASALSLYPNPVKEGNAIHLNEKASGEIMELSGKVVMNFSKQDEVSVQGLNKGLYIIRTEDGVVGKFIVE